MVNRQTAIIALIAAILASAATLAIDRIILHDEAAAELRHEAAQQKSDEAAAVLWMTETQPSEFRRDLLAPIPRRWLRAVPAMKVIPRPKEAGTPLGFH